MVSLVPQAHAAVDMAAFGRVLDPIVTHIVNPIVLLLFSVAIVVFVYGVLQMVIYADDAEARSRGKLSILGGLIGMFVMLSAWGIIALISRTIGGQ